MSLLNKLKPFMSPRRQTYNEMERLAIINNYLSSFCQEAHKADMERLQETLAAGATSASPHVF